MKLAMADPEVRARHAAAMADPEVRARHAAAMADPEVRARHAAAMADPEVRARHAAAIDGLSAGDRARVRQALQDKIPYFDIAYDFLISYSRVAKIAAAEGLQRRPRRKKSTQSEGARAS
jgi:hypothetical protein